MKKKLSFIHGRWRRLAIRTILNTLYFLNQFTSPRSRFHWIGSRQRGRRLERQLIILLFLSAATFLEPREYATWAAICGGLTAMLIPFLFLRYQLMRILDTDV